MFSPSQPADRNPKRELPGQHVKRRFIRRLLSLLLAPTARVRDALPRTPLPIPAKRSGHADANGISIYYAVYGEGPPVILLHGGLANADYWGNQIPALASHHTVITMDSRGHGRSTRDLKSNIAVPTAVTKLSRYRIIACSELIRTAFLGPELPALKMVPKPF